MRLFGYSELFPLLLLLVIDVQTLQAQQLSQADGFFRQKLWQAKRTIIRQTKVYKVKPMV